MEVEQGGSAFADQEKPAPTWKIITIASVAAGVQFGWALQLSLLTPYVQTLGVPHVYSTFVWLCGPLSGFCVQPTVGHFSDHCKSRFGRRRPFIIGGGCFVAIAVILIGFAKDIGHKFGDPLEGKTKPRAVAIFVFGFWILDVANNMLQGPIRAFLADLSCNDHHTMRVSNAYFSFFMAVGNVLGYAAGSYSEMYKIFPFTRTSACNATCANLKSCFLIDIILLAAVISFAACMVKEKQFVEETKSAVDKGPSISFVFQLVESFRNMTKPMWILLLVTLFNWIGWFPFWLEDTDWMGREVYGGKPEGSDAVTSLYYRGVRTGAIGLMINSVVLGLSSLAIEPLSKILGGPKMLWGFVNIILAAALGFTVLVTKVAEAWRRSHGLVAPPPNVKGGALAIFGILGIPLAITYSLPFAMASIYCSVAGGGQGLSLGVVNLSIVIPQLLVSLVSGPMDKALGGGNSPAFIMGAAAAVISAALAIFFLPKPPKEGFAQPIMAGGGH